MRFKALVVVLLWLADVSCAATSHPQASYPALGDDPASTRKLTEADWDHIWCAVTIESKEPAPHPCDPAEARLRIAHACEIDRDAHACLLRGTLGLAQAGGRKAALESLDRACAAGDASGCLLIGYAYFKSPAGHDRARAFHYLKLACHLGDDDACDALASECTTDRLACDD